jgi:hypothetical protein
MAPAGTNIRVASFSPGTGEPQTLQNHVCQQVFGFFHVAMRSWPLTHRNWSFGTTTTAMPLLPVDLRQIEQWHTYTPDRAASISNWTAPQLQAPVAIRVFLCFPGL